MKPAQGGHCLPAMSSQLGVPTQIFVLVALLTSTAVITRVIVLSNTDAGSFASPEVQVADCVTASETTSTYVSQPAKYTTTKFRDEVANPAQYRPYWDALDKNFDLHGYVISMKKDRYESASGVLAKLQITPHHYVPYSYKTKLVMDQMEKYIDGPIDQNDDHNLKMFSNRMAHTSMLFDFVNDLTANMNSWRFFFEDDIELHPSVTVADARAALAKGLEIAAADGIIYLGVCGPGRSDLDKPVVLARGINARKSHGTCTHAYGVTKWRAAGLLSYLDKVKVPEHYPRTAYMYFDILSRAYGVTVMKAWIVGFNLKSPVPQQYLAKQAHIGLIFQDRVRYPSFVSPRGNASAAAPSPAAP